MRKFNRSQYDAMLCRFDIIENQYKQTLQDYKTGNFSALKPVYLQQRIRNIERLLKAIKSIREFPFVFTPENYHRNFTYVTDKPRYKKLY